MSNIPSVSFEFFPPRTEEGALKLNETVKTLSIFSPEFFSVTFGAGGSTKIKTLETVLDIKSSGNKAVPHISCISSSKKEIRDLLSEYKKHKINHLIETEILGMHAQCCIDFRLKRDNITATFTELQQKNRRL